MSRPIVFAAALIAQAGTVVTPTAAQVIDDAVEYRACIDVAKKNPENGWEEALTWQSLGGGEAARHCGAVALIGLGKYGEAATRLETLANESNREETVRAEMFAQAGQAWMMEGNLQRADSAQRAALSLVPNHPDILLDHAVLLAQIAHYDESADVLSHVLRLQPNRVEALTLRGSAFRFLDRLADAKADIDQALALDPDFPDALLERGILARLAGDDAGARADWLRAIAIAPEADAADLARRNLEKMDVKTK